MTGRRWPAPTVVVTTVGLTGGWVAVAETLRDHADSPDWPSLFSWTAPLIWTAVAVVVAVAFADAPDERSDRSAQPSGCEAR